MSEPILDLATLDRLLEITGGDTAFLDELVDTYLEDGAGQITSMRAALAADDVEALVRPAHTLKSSSANVGAVLLADRCRTLEADARSGSVDDAVRRVDEIASAFDGVRRALLDERLGRGS